MASQDEAFQQRLLATFRAEAAERLSVLSAGLVELEQARTVEQRAVLLESLVREAHSLKGASRAVNLTAVETLARTMEQSLTALKSGEADASPALFDGLQRALDGVQRFLAAPTAGEAETAVQRDMAKPLPEHSPAIAEAFPPAAEPPTPQTPEMQAAPDTVRISTARLSALLLEVEQLLAAKLAEEHQVAELKEVQRVLSSWAKGLGKDAQESRSSQALLEAERRRLKMAAASIEALKKSAEQNFRYLGSALANLLDDMKSVLMLPMSTALAVFPKMVRDLSRSQSKEVDWVVSGGEIEIDKRVLDELKDPLIHLVRNCIDHGIEKPEDRLAKGKPRRGRIVLNAAQIAADKFEITVEDDGAGMDAARIRAAAVKQGLLSADVATTLSDEDALALIFRTGVSVSPMVTDLSGRGLGVPIVLESVAKLHGALTFATRPGTGTTFRMTLPLSLSIYRGVVIQCGEHLFILPTVTVEQVLSIGRDTIKMVENRAAIRFKDRVVSLVKLSDVLELTVKAAVNVPDHAQIVVVDDGGITIAFEVDAILNEQEVLVKPLGKQLARVRNIGGVAILGTGRVVPILNVRDLLVSAVKSSAGPLALVAAEKVEEKAKSLLVVEDSITTRTLLKNILEAAGYEVRTAVDGVDALARLAESDFDVVVSDIAMPRMDGFNLTARIRADKRLAELPVVLVTALESQQDKERGIDVGANAYLVKSSFDQSNLLEIIRRLI